MDGEVEMGPGWGGEERGWGEVLHPPCAAWCRGPPPPPSFCPMDVPVPVRGAQGGRPVAMIVFLTFNVNVHVWEAWGFTGIYLYYATSRSRAAHTSYTLTAAVRRRGMGAIEALLLMVRIYY